MGKKLIVKREIAAKAILFDCPNVPMLGAWMSEFSTADLIWFERILPIEGIKLDLPLWVRSSHSDGCGNLFPCPSGDGFGGYGTVFGDGNTDGYGCDLHSYGHKGFNGFGMIYGNSDGSGYGDNSHYYLLPRLLN